MNMFRTLSIATLVTTVLALSACAPASRAGDAESTSTPVAAANVGECGKDVRTITDALGEVTITGVPELVVVTEYAFVDATTLAGVAPIGIADDGNPESIIPEIRERFGDYASVGQRRSPNVPAILALEPDLVIIDSTRNADIYPQLADAVPTLAIASQESDYIENLDSLSVIAQALDRCEEMNEVIADHEERMADYSAELADLGTLPTFAFAVAADRTFNVHNSAGYVPSVLEGLGLTSAFPAYPAVSQSEVGLEALIAAAPEAMFVAEYTEANVLDDWSANALYQAIPAVEDGRVFSVDADVWARTRGLTAAELIAAQTVGSMSGD